MKKDRTRTKVQIETDVLTLSMRRCAFCFGIENDFTEKPGQIAHINGDRSNSSFSNLAWLCLEHHDRYDGSTSQSKGLTRNELKAYKEKLHLFVERTREEVNSRFLSSAIPVSADSDHVTELVKSTATEYNEYLIKKSTMQRNGVSVLFPEPQPERITTLNKSNELHLGSTLDWENGFAELSGKRVNWRVLVIDVSRALAPDGEYIIVHSQLANGGAELDWYFDCEVYEQELRQLSSLDIIAASGIVDSLGYVRNCVLVSIQNLTTTEYENLPVTPRGLDCE